MTASLRVVLLPVLALALLPHAGRTQPPSPAPAESLPVTRVDGDLKLTFTRLEVIPPPPGPPTDDPDEASWTRISFLFDWRGRLMREWSPQTITVLDAEGRTYTPRRTSTFLGKEGGNISFAGPIWDSSRPWKIRLELARTSPLQSYEFWKTYNPDEILTVRGLPVPPPGGVVKSGQTAETQGAQVELLGLAAGQTRLTDGLSVQYPNPTLHWRVTRPKGVHVTFLRATDVEGRVLIPRGAASGSGSSGERYARELMVPYGVKEIYVAFGIHKSRYFEFTAVPQP